MSKEFIILSDEIAPLAAAALTFFITHDRVVAAALRKYTVREPSQAWGNCFGGLHGSMRGA
jgi:hypothetical protein